MSVTVFGAYFTPMALWKEVLYYACMAVSAAAVCRNLALAVRASRSPTDSQKADLIRRGSIRKHLFRAAKVSLICGLLLFFITY